VTTRKLEMLKTLIKMDIRERGGTGAKSFAETAKPLFSGSIPFAASNNSRKTVAKPDYDIGIPAA